MRTREDLNIEIERKGTNTFQIIEVLLDIRELLQDLNNKTDEKK